MSKAILGFLLVVAPAAFLRAQALLPPDVVIPAAATWTVDITYRETWQSDNRKTSTRPKRVKIEAMRTGDVSRYHTTWSNGKTTEDWTTASDWHGPIVNFKVACSKRDDSGAAVEANVNGGNNLTLKYQRSDGTLSYFPYQLTCGI